MSFNVVLNENIPERGKICKYRNVVCTRSSCDSLDSSGNVVLCSYHRNPNGRFRFRIRDKLSVAPIFNKHEGRC